MVCRRLLLIFHSLTGLVQAWIIKTRKSMHNIRLSSTSSSSKLSQGDISFVIRCANILVTLGAVRTARKCFFRAFIMASVLRKWGIPVVMNVGLRNLKTFKRTDGHCWLTLDGLPFAETNNPEQIYPFEMGSGTNGVRYWIGANK